MTALIPAGHVIHSRSSHCFTFSLGKCTVCRSQLHKHGPEAQFSLEFSEEKTSSQLAATTTCVTIHLSVKETTNDANLIKIKQVTYKQNDL